MNCNDILDKYIKWIKDNTSVKSIKDGKICEIITPFLDRHNDHLQIYILKSGDSYKLTDDGYTLADLKLSGLEINTPKRQTTLKTALYGFGVKLGENQELTITANESNIGQKKHNLLQAILTINDMYILSQENIYSFFKEDVERYFQSNSIYFSRDIKIAGKTGFDHNIDFIISASQSKPERLIRTVNSPKKDNILSAIFAFNDIAQTRNTPTKDYVIYNDTEKKVSPDVDSALSNYEVQSIPWSLKTDYIDELTLN